MGWRERDWAKFTDSEKHALFGGGARSVPPSHQVQTATAPARTQVYAPQRHRPIRVRQGAWLAAVVSLAIFVAGQVPRESPLLPVFQIPLPSLPGVGSEAAPGPTMHRLSGPETARRGGVLSIAGQAPGDQTGSARVDVHWNARPWYTIAVSPLGSGGAYRVDIPLTETGMLNIRVVLPNGDQVRGSVRVTP